MIFNISRINGRQLVNVRMLTRIVGWLLIIEGIFMAVPSLVSFCYEESDWIPFSLCSIVTFLIGLILATQSKPTSMHTGKREGFLLTASVWIVFSIFGMLPFLFCNNHISVSDAFFEAMSGFTTTGASVITAPGAMSNGIHLWRAMMQWIGGMGIILFTLAIIPMLNHSGGMQMFNAEVTGITHDKIRPRISQTAKSLWFVYTLMTLALVLLLWAGPMNLFDSVCHAFGTVSTGGYSNSASGIIEWHGSVYVKIVLTLFMFLGGVNFALIFKTAHGDFKAMRQNDVFRTYIALIFSMLILFVISILTSGAFRGWESISIDPLFQVVSIMTSTGFLVEDFISWGNFALALAFFMMFFGACAGSTSGGAKIDRMIYLFRNSSNELFRCLHPNAVKSVKVNGKVATPELVNKVVAFLCIYMVLIVAGGIVLSAIGVPVVDAFFSAFSCISNTGISAGITGFGGGFDVLPDAAKWVLSFLMLTGRLEIFTVLLLFTPYFWKH